ncbi:MAG: YggS family pyridoxal phosphate-dependent enzyme [Christensenellales bacterium]|jgi:pyridoxal phosphate enzyme (YggS family)
MIKEEIAANIRRVREALAAAAEASGRSPREITLVGVTKSQPPEAIEAAVEQGLTDLGENYPQEFRKRVAAYPGAGWHFIGHLQTNKVKYVAGRAALVQSVGSLRLAQALSRYCERAGLRQPVLLQVNIGREPQKGGVMPEALFPLLEAAMELPGLEVRGLMAIPPAGENGRPWFAAMRGLWEKAQAVGPLRVLSMGMSADCATAVEEGATMVRVGRAIFGERKRKEGPVWQETASQDFCTR